MGNHSKNPHASAHPCWGRPLALYYSSAYDSGNTLLDQKMNHSVTSAVALRTKARTGIQKICDLGERRGALPPGYTKFVSLSMLESISKLVLLPKALADFAHPTLVSGCIKLMSTIQELGRISPFSYEYGDLCFRILVIALGVCLLERSKLLNSAISNMISEPLANPIMLLTKHVEHLVQIQFHAEEQILSGNGDQEYRIDPLLGIVELPVLLEILYDDRKAFSIALMHTNTLGLAGVMLSLGRCLDKETRATYTIVEMYCEVLWRYSNASAWDKVATQLLTNRYREEAKSTWKPTFVDLEDCVTIIRASDMALAPDDHRIPGPFDVSAIPVIVGFATPLIEPGSEDFIPPLLDATLSCMWNAIAGGQQPLGKLVDAVRDTFYHISKILSCAARQFSSTEPIHKQIIGASFRNDLFDLTAHLILVIAPRSGNSYFFGDAQNLFSRFCKLIPREELQDVFGDHFPEWLKYADYFFSCMSAFEFSKEDRDFFAEAVRCWNAIGVGLGYNGDMILATLHHCGYERCPHPCITQATQYVCSQCGEKRYCGYKCQLDDWLFDHGEGSHRQLCTGSP
ncbi:unnamed protein product [Rhizoctonia solani]|uniref:MYND-type domain-containing protein n=1 Tax=Rhizoctonia solani TaxID=456999 RepID=A0A8H3HEB7_9AGAM|nr:unnamed protein product [Rhizoctonia solani]